MQKRTYEALAIFLVSLAACLLHADKALAATKTVCAAGCDYTTLHDLFLSGTLNPGDTVNVGATYSTAGESFDIGFPVANLTLDCQNSGAVIGGSSSSSPVILYAENGGTVRNCNLQNLYLLGLLKSDVSILDNSFSGFSMVEVSGDNPQVDGNQHLNKLYFHDMSNAEASNNLLEGGDTIYQMLNINNVNGAYFGHNTVINTTVSSSAAFELIKIADGSTNITVDSNSIGMPDIVHFNFSNSIEVTDSDVDITHNEILFGGPTMGGSYCNGIMISSFGGDAHVVTDHNTLKVNPTCPRCDGITYADWTVNKIYATSTYNMVYKIPGSDPFTGGGFSSFSNGPDSNFIYYSDYNAAINFPRTDFPSYGVHSYTQSDPCFRTNDSNPDNDFDLAPYSYYLDVNGTEDIGAYSGVRDNQIHVDANGTVDFTNVDATSVSCVAQSLRDGDQLTVAAGDYGPLTITGSSLLTGDIQVTGAGADTHFVAGPTCNAVSLSGLTASSTFSDFEAVGSTSTPSLSYTMTRAELSYAGQDYDQGALIGSPNATIIVTGAPAGGSCPYVVVDNDGDTIPNAIGTNGQNWNTALVTYGGARLTMFGPANYVPDAAAFQGCAAPGAVTVNKFVSDIFTSSGIVLSYNQAAADAAGVSVTVGDTDPPAIARHDGYTECAGVNIDDSQRVTLDHIASSQNVLGLLFSGNSTGNIVTNSTLSGNTGKAVYYRSSGDNRLVSVNLDPSSALFDAAGYLDVAYAVRAHLRNASGNALGGKNVNLSSANSSVNETLTTDGAGYTPYSTPITAYRLTQADTSVTAGGFNPYTASTHNLSGYQDVDQTFNLTQHDQTVELVAQADQPASSGGGSVAWGDLPTQPLSYQSYRSDGQGGGSYLVDTQNSGEGQSATALVKLADDGNPKTQEDSAVYYLGTDHKRHAFPNEKVYFSWFCDYSQVKIVDPAYLASYPLGANVTYRPNQRLVKFLSQPQVYAVGDEGLLIPIADEATAIKFWGQGWNRRVDDISDAFFSDYSVGTQPYGDGTRITDMADISSDLGMAADDATPANTRCQSTAKAWPFKHLAPDWTFDKDLDSLTHDVVQVRALQEVLAYLGPDIYPQGSDTGNFGVFTLQAIKNYQQSVGLDATGFVGPATRAKLNALLDTLR